MADAKLMADAKKAQALFKMFAKEAKKAEKQEKDNEKLAIRATKAATKMMKRSQQGGADPTVVEVDPFANLTSQLSEINQLIDESDGVIKLIEDQVQAERAKLKSAVGDEARLAAELKTALESGTAKDTEIAALKAQVQTAQEKVAAIKGNIDGLNAKAVEILTKVKSQQSKLNAILSAGKDLPTAPVADILASASAPIVGEVPQAGAGKIELLARSDLEDRCKRVGIKSLTKYSKKDLVTILKMIKRVDKLQKPDLLKLVKVMGIKSHDHSKCTARELVVEIKKRL
jgi:chromosome segregation ATPase